MMPAAKMYTMLGPGSCILRLDCSNGKDMKKVVTFSLKQNSHFALAVVKARAAFLSLSSESPTKPEQQYYK
jgi:hypothetical protein